MGYLPRRFVTPITGILSLVIGISGVMLFFHLGEGLVKGVHEWLGIAFAAVMLAHLALNWTAFKQYFKRPAAWVATSVVTVITAVFLVTSASGSHENPMHSIVKSIETTAISDLAPLFKLSQSEMVQRLGEAGVKIETGRETLRELASSSGTAPRRLLATLMENSNQEREGKRGIAD
jgi:hypothetical protein